MRCTGTHGLGTILLHQVGSLCDGTSCVYHIIDDDHILAFHLTDNLHRGHYVGSGSCLVAEHEWTVQILGIRVGTLRTTYVRRCNHEIIEVQTLEVGDDHARCIEMIDGYIEESLNLVGMEIHGDDTVHTSHAQQVGHQFGTDAHTGLVLTVLSCPSEVGHHCIDGAG